MEIVKEIGGRGLWVVYDDNGIATTFSTEAEAKAFVSNQVTL